MKLYSTYKIVYENGVIQYKLLIPQSVYDSYVEDIRLIRLLDYLSGKDKLVIEDMLRKSFKAKYGEYIFTDNSPLALSKGILLCNNSMIRVALEIQL